MSDCKNCNLMKEKDEYITDIEEEECENLQEQNRILIERIKELEECTDSSLKR